jgi:Hypoxia induced protein conserved region
MSNLLVYLVPVSVFAVFCVLVLGLYTMMRGKSPNLSQTLMRWRVGLQFVAIVVIMAAVFVKRSVS